MRASAAKQYLRFKESGKCYRCGGERDGPQVNCSKCRAYRLEKEKDPARREYQAERKKTIPKLIEANRAGTRKWLLKNVYGITEEQRDEMEQEQKGQCAICGRVPTRTLHLDHDHVTGQVRALLCYMCNSGLGMFRDNPEVLQSAAKYLLKYS